MGIVIALIVLAIIFGGIGLFVAAAHEAHHQAGDEQDDPDDQRPLRRGSRTRL